MDTRDNNPCMGCPKAGCGSYHDQCQKHQEWKAKVDKQRVDWQNQRKADHFLQRFERRKRG